jgi:hypothetical protein
LDTGERSDFTAIQDIINFKDPFDKLWNIAIKLYRLHEKWMNGPMLDVNSEEVEQEVNFERFRSLKFY